MKDLLAARERFAPAPPVHVVVRKEDIDAARLPGRVAIVLDILFATTTIVTALAAGATAVFPAEDRHEARRSAPTLPADPASAVAASRIGRIVRGVGNDDEVRHASQLNTLDLVALLQGERIVRI